jgi:hypothetical protein
VLTGHTGSPRVIVQMAERRGIFANGYQFNQSSMAPRGFLTGAEWHGARYCRYAEMLREGKSVSDGSIPRRLTGTLKDAFCALSPFGPKSPSARVRRSPKLGRRSSMVRCRSTAAPSATTPASCAFPPASRGKSRIRSLTQWTGWSKA